MTHQSEETSLPPSLDSVLDGLSARHLPGDRAAIQAALVEREDQVADFLRLAGQQFGLFPQIVAEVLSQTGLGTPVSDRAARHDPPPVPRPDGPDRAGGARRGADADSLNIT
jgi:hypothetical protein